MDCGLTIEVRSVSNSCKHLLIIVLHVILQLDYQTQKSDGVAVVGLKLNIGLICTLVFATTVLSSVTPNTYRGQFDLQNIVFLSMYEAGETNLLSIKSHVTIKYLSILMTS